MICPDCKTNNNPKANYCCNCKREFSEEEQEKAYNKTIFHIFDIIEEWYYRINLEFITEHIAFKIFTLLVVLGIGIYFLLTKGVHTAIINDKNYDTYYNTDKNAYYIVVDNNIESTNIGLYIPNRVKEIKLKEYNSNDKIINETKISKKKGFKLKPSTDDYYMITSTYKNNKTENIKLYVYQEKDVEK